MDSVCAIVWTYILLCTGSKNEMDLLEKQHLKKEYTPPCALSDQPSEKLKHASKLVLQVTVLCESNRKYCIAGNVCRNLILRFGVETENVQFYSVQFYSVQYYFHAICVGVIRRGSDCHVPTCTEVQRGMALFK